MRSELSTESLGRWARRCGISYRTAWRWFRANRLPEDVVAQQMPTGTILVRDGRLSREAGELEEAIIYARINPRQDHSFLAEQIESCRAFCLARGWTIKRIVREVAPGVGLQRSKLARLIEQRTPRLVVASPTVISRFDFRFYEILWHNMDCQLVVVDRSDEIGGRGGALEDLTHAINIICHRHYGPKRGTALVELMGKVVAGGVSV
jgi:predicted site-specific integrase-resolvase